MRIIQFSRHFKRQLKKLARQNPVLARQTYQALALLQDTPHHVALNNHKLKNRDNHWSIRVTGDQRIIYSVIGGEIVLLMIGSHDEVY